MLNFFLHLDVELANLIANYGTWIYLILFAVIFVETGLVVMPLLPGDSLLFAAGTFAAVGTLDLYSLLGLLFIAAVLGDSCNYAVGRYTGLKALSWNWRGRVLVNPTHVERTQSFFAKYGSKAVVLARFVPIVRTFAPFMAGVGRMTYREFITYNVVGGFVWILSLTLLGFFVGQIPLIKDNFEKVILGIVALSMFPIIIELITSKRKVI